MSEQVVTKLCGICRLHVGVGGFHKRVASIDGLSAKCKNCSMAYDRARSLNPGRVAARKAYATTERGIEVQRGGGKRWIAANPTKRLAHSAVSNALRDGRLVRPPSCSACESTGRLHAHHDNYAKPLEVRWLCEPCHTAHHVKARNLDRFIVAPIVGKRLPKRDASLFSKEAHHDL